MDTPEMLQALTPVIEAFESLAIAYCIGGSVASSLYGRSRLTQDIDIVADLALPQVQPLVQRLQADYYIDDGMVQDAIQHRSSFNVLHHATGVKIDVFVMKSGPFAQAELQRARMAAFMLGSRTFAFATPEDTILTKLDWWKQGSGISARQWDDIVEVMKRQRQNLDLVYLRQMAPLLGVADIFEQALTDAGL